MGFSKPHVAHHRTREDVLAEATRVGHEIMDRARAALHHDSPHPVLALEQLRAELELAGHLAAEVRALLKKPAK